MPGRSEKPDELRRLVLVEQKPHAGSCSGSCRSCTATAANRSLRMHGTPPITAGSETMRGNPATSSAYNSRHGTTAPAPSGARTWRAITVPPGVAMSSVVVPSRQETTTVERASSGGTEEGFPRRSRQNVSLDASGRSARGIAPTEQCRTGEPNPSYTRSLGGVADGRVGADLDVRARRDGDQPRRRAQPRCRPRTDRARTTGSTLWLH
jgi:hypothetical protein